VVERCSGPIRRRVTRRAGRRETSRCMVRIGGTRIVLRVARVAIRRNRREVVVRVASRASHCQVEPSQRERSRRVVKR